MSKSKTAVIAAIAALVIEGVCVLCFTGFGPDGPASPFAWIGFLLLPAIAAGKTLGASSGLSSVLIPIFGFFEIFVPVWIVLRFMYARKTA